MSILFARETNGIGTTISYGTWDGVPSPISACKYISYELTTSGQRSKVTGRIAWSRGLVEGAVIVFSILLAFAIDAWWAGVGKRKKGGMAARFASL